MAARTAVGAGITVTALVAGLSAATLIDTGTPLTAGPASAAGLQTYDGCAPLLEAYRAELEKGSANGGYAVLESADELAVPAAAPQATSGDQRLSLDTSETAPVGVGETGTNVQERGVDEPDIIKVVGANLVTVTGGVLRVVSTGAEPREVGRLALPDAELRYSEPELLVAGNRVLLLEQGNRPQPVAGAAAGAPAPGTGRLIAPEQPFSQTTVLRLADLSDPSAPRWLESFEVDGSYVSARLAGGAVRLVTRSTPRVPVTYPGPAQSESEFQQQVTLAEQANKAAIAELTAEQVLPQQTRRDASGDVTSTGSALECADVSYAEGTPGASTLLVTTLRPSAGLAPLDNQGIRADGELVYATADRLFVATSQWGTVATPAAATIDIAPQGEVTTQVHSFDTTDPTALDYVGSGSVDGYIYGRWALSWHDGSLRVATTTGAPWGGAQEQSESSVTVLRENAGGLAEVGRVDGLGKGEKIYAVRYFGDLATVVTFRQTDPLYVVDLKDPTSPAVLGELKVPGFSTYLHPIGDDRLLGIGMEADEQTGRTTGMQASVYSIADLSTPIQVDRLQLGQGYSEALNESRAFSYDPARRLAVLPFNADDGASYGLGIRVATDGTLSEAGRVLVSPGRTTPRGPGVPEPLPLPVEPQAVPESGSAGAPGSAPAAPPQDLPVDVVAPDEVVLSDDPAQSPVVDEPPVVIDQPLPVEFAYVQVRRVLLTEGRAHVLTTGGIVTVETDGFTRTGALDLG